MLSQQGGLFTGTSNRTKYDNAVENVVNILIPDQIRIGQAQLQKFAWLVDKVLTELDCFQNTKACTTRTLQGLVVIM